jgi:exodeoxyribonuclease VII large subunit
MSSRNEPAAGRANRDVMSVSRLNFEARDLLEAEFPAVWVEGEISNLARPASGHLYFSLKDEQCQIRAAMFKNKNRLLDFRPANGTQVLVRARVSLYPNRGDFQLIAESMEESGEGALRRAFEALKKKLDSEGLFASENKQALPTLPAQIGVITSPSGAAIRDICSVLARRFPSIPIVIYPVPVQGQGAGDKIARMIALACRRKECDVLILSRGGGSLEDLWAFNEEVVARAIFDASIPVVSGVGHEIDFTIADFVADLRAPTPSAAAEVVTPDRAVWLQRFESLQTRLSYLLDNSMAARKERVLWLISRLIHPRRHLQDLAQRADETALRLHRAMAAQLSLTRSNLSTLNAELRRHDPKLSLELHEANCHQLARRLATAIRIKLTRDQSTLNELSRTFQAVSPRQTLGRGYAIVTARNSGEIVRAGTQVHIGDEVTAMLADGTFTATVTDA